MRISRQSLNYTGVLMLVVALSIVLRVFDFPSRYEIRDMDETGYCDGCLQLLEGIMPGNKAAPAGPLYWAGWAWVGGQTVYDLVHPTPRESHESLAVRPLSALDRTMFDDYRDISLLHRFLVVLNVSIAVLGSLAAAGLGIRYAGAIGGILLGGLFAGVPVFLDLSEMSRPYSMAWSLGMMALFFASGNDAACARRRWMLTAIFLGLSIASRIEMLCLIPIVWWVLWDRPNGGRIFRAIIKVTVFSIAVAIFCAPWLMTHLIGNLRAIATVRFGGPPGGTPAWQAALFSFTVDQGMIGVILVGVIGLFFQPPGSRFRRAFLGVYALLLLVSMLTGFAYGIHQHGAVFIAWFLLVVVIFQPLETRWPWICNLLAIGALVFPLIQSSRDIRATHAADDREDSVRWVEQHVPAGTTVYLFDGGMRSLLPTSESAAALWNEVNDDQAWRKKVESGLTRFKLSADELPRALSEENLIQERANRRKWFILGGKKDPSIPRYDIRMVMSSPVFGIHDLDSAMKQHGGVLIWRDGYDMPIPNLGPPLVQWLNADRTGVRIFCTPDVRPAIQ
jgi:hypothetical protein